MSFNRIRVSSEATARLSLMKGKTGLTPNILCRLAFCYSLNDSSIPNPAEYNSEGQEINRFTLTGEWDGLFMAFLKERLITDGLDSEKDLQQQFKAHINRGIFLIYPRVKSLGDLQNLLHDENKKLV